MQENYLKDLASHTGNGEPGGGDGHDADYARGMFQEPVVNCNGVYTGSHQPSPWFRSMLWLSVVSGVPRSQHIHYLGHASNPHGDDS